MSTSSEWLSRRERVVAGALPRVTTLVAESAKGAIIVDVEGREYIDFAGGIGVMNVGHCDPAVVAAIKHQSDLLLHTSIHVTTYAPYVELCEKLVELLPHDNGQNSTKCMLINSGAEAVENAIKIARQATGRPGVICFTGAFHGRTFMAASLTSKIDYKKGCRPFMSEVYRLPFPKREPGEGISDELLAERELARLRRTFKDTVAPADVAAIIIELVQGEGGFYVAPKQYVQGLRELCDEHGIVLIFDEVQSGFARTGAWASYEHFGVKPDVSTWAKSMGGGLPIAAVLGKSSVIDRVAAGTLGSTYGGNPVACAAALATIKSMEKMKLNQRAREIGQTIRDRFESTAKRIPAITDVRGLGAMLAMELHENGDFSRPGGALVKKIAESCLDRGLLIIPAGIMGNVIRILCPLVISDEQLRQGLDILDDALDRHAGSVKGSPVGAGAKGG